MKVFVGYPSEHRREASAVATRVEELGHEVWIDKRSLVGADDWDAERLAAQRAADFIIHLVSPEMLRRAGPVHREINETVRLVDDQPPGSNYVLFLQVGDVLMPAQFQRFHYFSLSERNWKDQIAKAVTKRADQLSGVVDRPRPLSERNNESERVSLEEEKPGFRREASYIRYTAGTPYWQFVNSAIETHVLSPYFVAAREMTGPESHPLSQENPSFSISNAQEFYRSHDFVSVRCIINTYWSGAAHPNHHASSLNFWGPDCGLVTAFALFGGSSETGVEVLERCLDDIRDQFTEPDGGIVETLTRREDLLREPWDHLENFNFDPRGLTFQFNPYEVMPFAFGVVEVFVPWSFLRRRVTRDFQPILDVLSE